MNRAHASIDIGSNTLRLLIARPATDRNAIEPWEELGYAHRIARLGEGLHHNGMLSDAGIVRTLQALREFRSLIDEHNVPPDSVFAVATAAVREAENGRTFRDKVLHETGIDICIISGDEEASRSLKGSSSVLNSDTRNDMLLFDIGGGSTEFIRADAGGMIDAISCKLGVVRLVEAHLHNDPPSADDFRAIKETVSAHLDSVEKHWRQISDHAPKHLVGTAGTVTTLAAVQLNMTTYDAHRINNHVMQKDEFTELKERLLAMNHAEREMVPAIESGRADLIIAGLAMIEAIMERWNYRALISVDAGLLEGNWLASYANITPQL